jgi:hypothetical protein
VLPWYWIKARAADSNYRFKLLISSSFERGFFWQIISRVDIEWVEPQKFLHFRLLNSFMRWKLKLKGKFLLFLITHPNFAVMVEGDQIIAFKYSPNIDWLNFAQTFFLFTLFKPKEQFLKLCNVECHFHL